MGTMQCNVEFGYQLSICSGTKENNGKRWSSWPVAGPSDCKLTSSQQSGINFRNPNISPYSLQLYFYFLFLFFFYFLFFFITSYFVFTIICMCVDPPLVIYNLNWAVHAKFKSWGDGLDVTGRGLGVGASVAGLNGNKQQWTNIRRRYHENKRRRVLNRVRGMRTGGWWYLWWQLI
jgi:hypothetical protein